MMINQDELQAAAQEAAELTKRLKNSPLWDEWKPRIEEACDRIDEACSARDATAFRERVHELSEILQEVKRLLGD